MCTAERRDIDLVYNGKINTWKNPGVFLFVLKICNLEQEGRNCNEDRCRTVDNILKGGPGAIWSISDESD